MTYDDLTIEDRLDILMWHAEAALDEARAELDKIKLEAIHGTER